MDDELDQLVARSRRIGADVSLVIHGGGNTSSKADGLDHVGRERPLLLIKGSGSDLRTAEREDFCALYLDDLRAATASDVLSDDEMVFFLLRCMADPNARRPSIETLLHAFLPARHVDHVHSDAVCALANGPAGREAVAEALGEDIAYVEYVRPGFALCKRVASLAVRYSAVVLDHHGLVTWGETHEECLARTMEVVERAGAYLAKRASRPIATSSRDVDDDALLHVLPALRGRLSRECRRVLHIARGMREIADRDDVDRIVSAGPATADHVLRIGAHTLVLRVEDDLGAVIGAFENDSRKFFQAHAHRLESDFPMHEPIPRVMLLPGMGCVAAAPTKRDARIASEVAAHTFEVAARSIDALGGSVRLTDAELFDIEYWGLELYKLSLAPPPAEMSGRIALVAGAASGIGRAVALDLAARGAHLVLCDIDGGRLAETADRIPAEQVACVDGDLTEERVVDRAVREAVLEFGGLDAVISSTGIGMAGALTEVTRDQWSRAMDVNMTSSFLLLRRVWPVFERQQIGGSIVIVGSKNAFAPGAGFGPYSVSKAALVQLARIAALEGGPIGVRVNVVNPDAVFEGSRLWSPTLRAERAAAHGVRPEELEDFYARRSLLGLRVLPQDVADAVAFLVSDRSRATTGCVVTVDGGVAAAFPR